MFFYAMQKMFAQAMLLIVFVAALVSCQGVGSVTMGRSSSVPFDLDPSLPATSTSGKKATEIQVVDISSLSKRFVVVGIAEAEASSAIQAVNLLKKEAAKLGGDAILDFGGSVNSGSNMGLPVVGDLTFRGGRTWTTRVIRWIPGSSRPTKQSRL